MPRRAEITPRMPDPDPVYSSQLVSQLTNRVMVDGKKSVAEKLVYDALETVGARSGTPPVEALAPRRRRQLPGSRRGPAAPRSHARDPLARPVRARSSREGVR